MKFGFIGTGNMGGAIIGGMVKNYNPCDIIVFDKNKEAANKISEKFGVMCASSVIEFAECEFLFLCFLPW